MMRSRSCIAQPNSRPRILVLMWLWRRRWRQRGRITRPRKRCARPGRHSRSNANPNDGTLLKRLYHLLACLGLLLPHVDAAALPRKPAPNVLLITIDTVRADHIGCYGATDVQTPTLDALARDGIRFEHAISQVPLTWPSHAAILTGTYPFQNGVQDFTGQPLAPQFRSVAQAFKQQGYATGAVVSAFVLDRSWGLARGFDFYDDAFSAESFVKKDIGLVDRRAGESVTHALNWLGKEGLKKTPRAQPGLPMASG